MKNDDVELVFVVTLGGSVVGTMMALLLTKSKYWHWPQWWTLPEAV